ncbi:MAG: 2-hydroxy-3-oxopropionate reductase [Rhodospirillaceae bacterium]|nr:2-hydroxy-3-oxopropionate reductase [Rhodospirillaceae bacterium]
MPAEKIGYIGLGFMGTPMAKRLVEAGYEVTVWGRTASKVEPVVAAGAKRADTAADLARACDIIFLCVSDTDAVTKVVFGPDGVAAGAGKGKILVDMSSIKPEATQEMAKRLKDETGMAWIDAPVSGGVVGSENGTLTVMAGGEQADFDAVKPVVDHLAKRFTLMGPNGAGQATKLINQAIVGCAIVVLAEVTSLAQRSGIDAARIPEALAGGRADSLPLQQFMPKMAKGDFFLESYMHTMLKDLDSVLDAAREVAATMPLTSTATQMFRLMAQRGMAEEDITAMVKLYREGPL